MIGGHVETNETIANAIARELREELGVHATVGDPLLTITDDTFGTLTIWLVTQWHGTVTNHAPEEHTRLEWFSASDIAGLSFPHPAYLALIESLFTPVTTKPSPSQRIGRIALGLVDARRTRHPVLHPDRAHGPMRRTEPRTAARTVTIPRVARNLSAFRNTLVVTSCQLRTRSANAVRKREHEVRRKSQARATLAARSTDSTSRRVHGATLGDDAYAL